MFGFLHDVFDKLGQVTAQRQQSELEQLLRLAKDEITSLRRENELLLARVETMELCALLLRASQNIDRLYATTVRRPGNAFPWYRLRRSSPPTQDDREIRGATDPR